MTDLMNFDDLLKGLGEKSAGSGGDFWRPEKTGKYILRPYRFQHEGKPTFVATRAKHFQGKGSKPVDCTGQGCKVCENCEKLAASKDKGARDKAYETRRTIQFTGVFVLADDPTGFKMWEMGESVSKKFFLAVAKIGGFTGNYPTTYRPDDEKATAEDREAALKEWTAFKAAFDKALPLVCGPHGWDFCVTYNKETKNKKEVWAVDFVMRLPGQENVLPFAEDDAVPDPYAIYEKIEAKK